VDWFYPGALEGHEFVYSAQRERVIKESKSITVAANSLSDLVIQSVSDDASRERLGLPNFLNVTVGS
jgi:hypothetical protein